VADLVYKPSSTSLLTCSSFKQDAREAFPGDAEEREPSPFSFPALTEHPH